MSQGAAFIMMVIAMNAIMVMIFVGLIVLLMWIVGRFIRREAAMAIGVLAIAFVVYFVVNEYRVCSAEPIFVDPEPGSGGAGSSIFPCDAPSGIISYLFIWYTGPITVALLLAATSFQYWQLRRQR